MKRFDIVEFEDRLEKIERAEHEIFALIEQLEPPWKEWKKAKEMSPEEFENDYRNRAEKLGEAFGVRSLAEYRTFAIEEEASHRGMLDDLYGRLKLMFVERGRMFESLRLAVGEIRDGRKGAKRRMNVSEHALVARLVDRKMKANQRLTKNEAFYEVADSINKSFEAVKFLYYYKPKKVRKKVS